MGANTSRGRKTRCTPQKAIKKNFTNQISYTNNKQKLVQENWRNPNKSNNKNSQMETIWTHHEERQKRTRKSSDEYIL